MLLEIAFDEVAHILLQHSCTNFNYVNYLWPITTETFI